MTKRRAPITIENALFRVLGELGLDRAAEVTGREAGYLRSLSDPDTRYALTVADAIRLDLAYRAEREAAAGPVYPIYEAYGLILEATAKDRFASAEALQRQAAAVVQEGGEAAAALIRASLPNATLEDRRAALRELEQSIAADTAAIRLLQEGGTDMLREAPG
jgi:hypothetical protein